MRLVLAALAVVVSGCTSSAPRHEMIFVEGGNYWMGCTEEQEAFCLSDETLVEVELDDFWISKYEVTNAQFAEFLTQRGNQRQGDGLWYLMDEYALIIAKDGDYAPKAGFEHYPVSNVSWYGATAYAEWLSEDEQLEYRLPTEAQWEYAARGGQSSVSSLYSGSDQLDQVAWCDEYSKGSGTGWGFNDDNGVHPVGSRQPNALGIHDLSGNVREWVSDHYENYLAGGNNPKGSAFGSLRVKRGGSWDNSPEECRVSSRGRGEHVSRFAPSDGFRVIRAGTGR